MKKITILMLRTMMVTMFMMMMTMMTMMKKMTDTKPLRQSLKTRVDSLSRLQSSSLSLLDSRMMKTMMMMLMMMKTSLFRLQGAIDGDEEIVDDAEELGSVSGF